MASPDSPDIFYQQPSSSAVNRRHSRRLEVKEPCSYVFNIPQGDSYRIYQGEGVIQNSSATGVCLQLRHEPADHGIVEIRTARSDSLPSRRLVGICWTRKLGEAEDRPMWLAGGRFLVGYGSD